MPVLDTLNPATLLSGRFKQEQIPDLSGRVAVVTGGSAGIGYHCALGLARAGAKVLILSATPAHGEPAEQEMRAFLAEHAPESKGSVTYHQLELGDLKAVDALAKQIAKDEDRLDILINNAGVGQAPYGLTKDGIENHFGVNNLSHFVLTLRLLPLMLKTAETAPPTSVRICMQSSELHRMAPSDAKFATLEEINEKRDPTVAYGRTKLGNILFARQLVKRKLPATQNTILVTSVHPGTVDTDIQEGPAQSYGLPGQLFAATARLLGKSAPEGAEAALWAATATDINAGNFAEFQGNYYAEAYGKPHTETAQAQDEALGDAFWAFCAERAEEILHEDVTA